MELSVQEDLLPLKITCPSERFCTHPSLLLTTIYLIDLSSTPSHNVFAERAGVYSKGASGDFKEIVNLFEVQHAVVTAGDSSLDITSQDL